MADGLNNTGGSRKKWLILIVIAAVVLLAAFASMGRKEVPIRVEQAKRGSISSAIATNGKVEPVERFEAHAPSPATVRRVLVHEGDHVKAGQLLLELDNADAHAEAAKAQAQVRAAQADLAAVRSGGTHEEVLTTQSQVAKARIEVETAQRNLQALQRLQQKGAASGGEVQAAQNRLRAAEADFKLARGRQSNRYSPQEVQRVQAQITEARAALSAANDLLQHSEIRAPRAGTVYALPVRAGQYVAPGDLLVQVADLSKVQVRVYVDEPDIGRLQTGQPVNLKWDAAPDRIWHGTLTRTPTNVVTVGSRNVGEVICQVDNSDLKLLPNVTVSVDVITNKVDNTITVPREAVHSENGNVFVYEVVNGRLHRQNVQTGISNLTRIGIVSGLRDSAPVVVGATNGKPLQNGTPVRIIAQ
jgi:HlyD family secretion protein